MSSHSCLQTSASSLRCCSGYCRTTQHGVAGILDGTAHGFPDLPRSWLFFVTLQLHGKSTRHQPATARQAAETSLIPRILSLQLLPFTSSHRFPSTLNTRPFSEPPKRSQGQEGRECLDTVTRFGDLAQRRVISQVSAYPGSRITAFMSTAFMSTAFMSRTSNKLQLSCLT